MVWCGVVWCGVMWCGVGWGGGVVGCGVVLLSHANATIIGVKELWMTDGGHLRPACVYCVYCIPQRCGEVCDCVFFKHLVCVSLFSLIALPCCAQSVFGSVESGAAEEKGQEEFESGSGAEEKGAGKDDEFPEADVVSGRGSCVVLLRVEYSAVGTLMSDVVGSCGVIVLNG